MLSTRSSSTLLAKERQATVFSTTVGGEVALRGAAVCSSRSVSIDEGVLVFEGIGCLFFAAVAGGAAFW